MSTAKRSRQRQSDVGTAAASLPPTKRVKTTKDSHVPTTSGLAFLTDEKKRTIKKLSGNLTNGVNDTVTTRPDESHTVIASLADVNDDVDMQDALPSKTVVEIDSDDSEEDEEESSDEEEKLGQDAEPLTNGTTVHDEEEDAQAGAEDTKVSNGDTAIDEDAELEKAAGPSFADLLQASHPDMIDVQASFADQDPDSNALVPARSDKALQAPSATSLGTVLTQALRTNDKELLESCFQMTDPDSIRSTIQRLQSSLVSTLLQRIAERLHKRPGRAGNLMIWVQWSLVAHGGYLASQPQVMRKLKSLSQVVRERANGLQSLMTLKGKLDMLSAQIELRRTMQEASKPPEFDSDDDDEDGIIYVEGEDDQFDSERDDELNALRPSRRRRPKTQAARADLGVSESGDDVEDDDDVPMTNGVVNGVDEESSDGEDEEQVDEGLLDDEAEETSDDEGEDTSEEADSDQELDEDDDEDSASEDDEAPATKSPKAQQRSSMARRR